MPPTPLQVGHHALSSKSPNIWLTDEIIGRKMEQNLSKDRILSEDLFFLFCFSSVFGTFMGRILSLDLFFCSLPDFGENMGRILSEDLFFFFALHLFLGKIWDEF